MDARLTHINGLLVKALVPFTQCVSDVGEKKGKTVNHYLEGLNDCL